MKGGVRVPARSSRTSSSSAAPRSPTTASTTSSTTARPRCAVALDSPVFKPQQFYLIGFVQDSWRASDRLTLELGLRYDYYSVVKEAERPAPSRSSSRTTRSAPTRDNFYDAGQEQLLAAAVGGLPARTTRRCCARGFGLFYGPGQFEDRIQPIENYIERRRVQAADVPNNGLPIRLTRRLAARPAVDSRLHARRPDEYNMQYGVSLSRELPGAINLTVGYTGSQGKDMFLRGVGNTLDPVTRARPVPSLRPDRLQDVGLRRRPGHRRQRRSRGCGYAQLRRAAAERDAPLPRRLHRRPAVPVLAEQGHDAGIERGGDDAEHVRLRDRVRHQPAGHPAHVQRLAGLPDSRRGLLDGRLARRRHRQRPQRRAASTSRSAGRTTSP